MARRDTYRPIGPGRGATKLTEPSSFRGTRCTVAEAIISRIAAGAYLEPACSASGANARTVYNWLRTGTEARRRYEDAQDDGDPAKVQAVLDSLSEHQAECMHFAVALERAEADWLEYAETQLDAICRGGQVARKVTVKKNAAGDVTETIEVTEEIPVDPRVLMWRLERRYPALYGKRPAEVAPKPEQATKIALIDAGELAAKLLAAGNGNQGQPRAVLEVNGKPALEAAG